MEKPNAETLLQELRMMTNRLNQLSEYVKTVNDHFQKLESSEQKMYAFLGTLVDKILHHHEKRLKF